MYSILIKGNSGDKLSYYLNTDGTIYTAGSLTLLQDKVAELLNTYPLEKIVPIKNCIVTNNVVIIEAV